MKIRKTTFYIIMTITLIVIAGYFLMGKSDNAISNPSQNAQTGDVQKVVIGIKDYNYYPNTITVKSGIPVRIYLDNTVRGCYRGFVIRDFGINKYLATPNDYIEFTPDKKGTFRFSCSMGMGTGTIIVQ